MRDTEPRRYRIMSVLGKGGFGKVYRGRLEGPEGFYKDVAIKLLNDADVPESTLQRFRDEARILGLIRDRAIVTVDPPTRLDGRWAVVMEYVDGVSCSTLLRQAPFPPKVAAEIIQECARALDKVYRQPGHDGQPLKLLHRDLKPGNIQVTNSGEVKILDFGIARADFADREAETTHHIGGTIGYIAPERLGGQEGPEGDIYSLGVVLHVLITGDKPTRPGDYKPRKHVVERTGDVATVLAFAKKMTDLDPSKRPTARQVEDGLNDLKGSLSGLTLRRWAEQIVPEAASMAEDGLVGSVVTETLANLPLMPDSMPDFSEARTKGPNLVVVLSVALIAVVAAAGLGFLWISTQSSQPEVAMTEPVESDKVAVPDMTEKTEPGDALEDNEKEEQAATEKADAPAAPEPTVTKTPVRTPAVAKAAAPKPVPAPAAPTGPTFNLTFSSIPLGATVYVDGKKLGTTPLVNTPIVSGEHKVRLEGSSGTIERTIRVSRRGPTRYIWKGSEEWEVHH